MTGQPKRPWRLMYKAQNVYWRVYGTYATREAAERAEKRRPIVGALYKVEGP